MRNTNERAEFFIFALIGLSNTFVHGTVLILAVDFFNLSVELGHLVAFLISNVLSFFLNSIFTFKQPLSLSSYYRFLLASMLALALTLIISSTANYLGFHYLIGYCVVVATVPVLTFVTLKSWAFAKK